MGCDQVIAALRYKLGPTNMDEIPITIDQRYLRTREEHHSAQKRTEFQNELTPELTPSWYGFRLADHP